MTINESINSTVEMNSEQKQLLYLADDHVIVANALSSLIHQIDSTIEIVLFPNGEELFKEISQRKPNIVFLDIEMPVWDGRKTLQEIKTNFPDIPCLILSMNSEKSVIQDCINIGANAYLLKDSSLNEFKDAFEHVKQGKIYFSIEILKVLSSQTITTFQSSTSKQIDITFSDREKEVLKFICDGLSPKEIAEKLFISPRTVETHKNNIMQKLEITSVGKLISFAIKNNLV